MAIESVVTARFTWDLFGVVVRVLSVKEKVMSLYLDTVYTKNTMEPILIPKYIAEKNSDIYS